MAQKTEPTIPSADVAAADNRNLRVLVLAAAPKDFKLTRDILSRAGVECEGCSTIDEITTRLADGAGAVLIPEEAVLSPDNSLARYLAGQPSWSDLPVLVLARPGADSAGVATAMDKYGNVAVLERPMRIASLVSAVRSALRARTRQYQVRDDARTLQEAHDLLEQRVRERTIELHQTNKELEKKVRETQAAEERAHVLLHELVTAQETERARIARDLHDELGQQVTSLRLHLGQIERDLSAESRLSVRDAIAALDHEAEKIDDQISFLAWKIRPTTIEELGLARALQGYVREWSRNFDIEAGFRESNTRSDKARRLLPEIEVNVYRIAQESLNNIAKYAHATTVDVLVSINDREVSLIVEDDGRGFDLAATNGSKNGDPVEAGFGTAESRLTAIGGLGLRGMHERAALLGGTLQIESTPGLGTTVFVRIPARFR